jgi:hypothetical protein
MNTFNKKSLCAAMAALGALGITGTADAVYLNPDGLGQVLIYPYYTVRETTSGSAFNSLLSVVNSTASAKAVKVRFIEGRNSVEVLDFNLFLSAKDVWTAAIVPTSDGAGVISTDKSCIAPQQISTGGTPTSFVNFQYTGDGGGDSLDRTREGYVEIIEMGALVDGSPTAVSVTHVNGTPKCDKIDDTNASAAISAPTGGLFGGITIINVLGGEEFTQDATALNAFRTSGAYDTPGDIKPDLRDVNPPTATIFDGTTGSVITSTFGAAIDAVSAVLMHDHLYNEFVLDAGTVSGTDWVVTMPTKRYYFDSSGVVQYLFQRDFIEDEGACDDVTLGLFDREEFKKQGGFSPPPRNQTTSICWEANVITFNNSNVFASQNSLNINTDFANGWMDLGLPPTNDSDFGGTAHALFDNGTRVFLGLPTIGFSAITFNNGTLVDGAGLNVKSLYGGTFKHRATETTVIQAP